MTAFRCAVQSEVRGDSMLGTAPPQTRVLIVHQPGPWGPRGLVESRCDPDVARRLDAAAAKAGMRLQTVRRPGKHEFAMPEGGYHVGIADTTIGEATITWWRTNDLREMARELEHGWPTLPPDGVDTAPLYLVCAHGRHDACCALRGRPVAAALEAVRPGRVWETTHLGGDRFAANLLILPTGELYGRVPPALAAGLAERADAGEVVPRLMRGRIGSPPIAQAALIYAHEQLGIVNRDAFRVASMEAVDANLTRVRLTTSHGSVIVTVGAETSPSALLTCRGSQAAKFREYRGVELTKERSWTSPS